MRMLSQPRTESQTRIAPVDAPPRASRPRRAVTWRLLEQVAHRVPVDLVLPDGSLLGRAPGAQPTADRPRAEILRPDALLDRMASEPKMAFGEGYMAGDWRPAAGTDLAAVLLPFAQRQRALLPAGLSRLRRLVSARTPSAQRNSPAGARRNIAAHYDLSNDLFAAFLDETLTYSSARFDDARPWADQTLEEAQLRKVELLRPRTVIAKNTVEALQSGMVFGVASQVEGIVARMIAELGAETADVDVIEPDAQA